MPLASRVTTLTSFPSSLIADRGEQTKAKKADTELPISSENPSVKLGVRKKVKLGRALADVDSDSPLFVDALGDQGSRPGLVEARSSVTFLRMILTGSHCTAPQVSLL
ncbi:hypothetical protein Bbelb_253140 [Branchiostoma belcheri]|nr:hypothetical protein Bbelb_253140 [Branchiostoma belcheri]